MIKCLTRSIAAGALLVAVSGGGVASGSAPPVRGSTALVLDFDPAGQGETENPCCQGLGVLHYSPNLGQTDIVLALANFVPGTVYGVRLDSDGGGFSNPQAVTTDQCGLGLVHLAVPQDRTGHPVITVYIWDGDFDPDSIDFVSSDEIRAVGH